MKKRDEIVLDPLASRVEEALLLTGESATKFGYINFGDPAFVLKMRKGRQFRPPIAARLKTILENVGV